MMPIVREETRLVMGQLRRNIASYRGSKAAGTTHKTGVVQTQLVSSQQHRSLQHVTSGSASSPSVDPALFSRMLRQTQAAEVDLWRDMSTFSLDAFNNERPLASKFSAEIADKQASIMSTASVINNGKQVEVDFRNGDKYVFHTSWLKDSAVDNFGASFNRNCPHDGDRSRASTARSVSVQESGAQLCVDFEVSGTEHRHAYDTRWLHAFAPYVAQPITGEVKTVEAHGSMLSQLTVDAHQSPEGLWGADKAVPEFTCDQLTEDPVEQKRFLEVLAKDGVAIVYNVPAPADLTSEEIGRTLERTVNKVVGAMYQPPRRKTNYGIMRADMSALNIGGEEALADYNFTNPLSMHTDHAIYEETPGYLQWNWQAQASVTTKICNGITVAEHIRKTNPAAFKLLTSVHVTHAVRTNHYTFDGEYANSPGRYHEGTFEQMHTHPIIKLDENGNVVQVIHNELKRGVSAIPFDVYDEFNEAYSLWKNLCEDPRFTCEVNWPEHSCVVLNNHIILHGRATPTPGDQTERIMVWGYTRKDITENRYRLLKQQELQHTQGITDDYTRAVPNQVLMAMEVE